jgi:hypothetical protein
LTYSDNRPEYPTNLTFEWDNVTIDPDGVYSPYSGMTMLSNVDNGAEEGTVTFKYSGVSGIIPFENQPFPYMYFEKKDGKIYFYVDMTITNFQGDIGYFISIMDDDSFQQTQSSGGMWMAPPSYGGLDAGATEKLLNSEEFTFTHEASTSTGFHSTYTISVKRHKEE